MTPEEIDAEIEKARNSPQSNKLLLDIHKAQMEVEKTGKAMDEMEQKRQQVLLFEQELKQKVSNLSDRQQQQWKEVRWSCRKTLA